MNLLICAQWFLFSTKGRYGNEGERFTYTLALVFVQCLVNMAFAQGGE